MSDPTQVSVKELASKLKTSDSLLKKFIKDFDIATVYEKKLLYVSTESAEILKEIIRLRNAGKKNTEIKKLFEEAQKAQKQEEAANAAAAELITVEPEAAPIVEATPVEENQPAAVTERVAPAPEIAEEYYNEYLAEQISETAEDTVSLAMQQAELGDEAESVAAVTETNFDEEPEAEEEEEEKYEAQSGTGAKRRRRQFSFRFIQRQIANDMKRVDYIRHKLKRGKLSTLEKLHLEDSLEKRSSLLKGWTHLLRWVKN